MGQTLSFCQTGEMPASVEFMEVDDVEILIAQPSVNVKSTRRKSLVLYARTRDFLKKNDLVSSVLELLDFRLVRERVEIDARCVEDGQVMAGGDRCFAKTGSRGSRAAVAIEAEQLIGDPADFTAGGFQAVGFKTLDQFGYRLGRLQIFVRCRLVHSRICLGKLRGSLGLA